MAIENTNRIIKNETIFMEDDGGFATPIPISQEYIPSGLRTPPRPSLELLLPISKKQYYYAPSTVKDSSSLHELSQAWTWLV